MSFRNVAASLTLDITDYRAKLNAVAADTRRVAAQLNGSMSATGFDKLEGDITKLDRTLTTVPEHARQAGASSSNAFGQFGSELGQLDDQAARVALSQGQISEAAAEASRRAGGAYRAIGTEANSAAASARSGFVSLSTATTGVVTSANTATMAEREIGVAATRSASEAKAALAGLAGAHTPIVVGATEAAIAEGLIGEASLRSLTQVERSAIAMAAAEGRISAAAAASALKQVASSEQVAAAILRETEAMALRDAQARASTLIGGGGPIPPTGGGGRGPTGGPTGRAGTVLAGGSMALEGSARGAITAGAGLVLGFGLAERAVMRFDKELSNVAATSGATGTGLASLRTSALEAGQATSFSASEAAKAEAELARAGLTVQEITGGGLRAALDLAAAGQLDLGEAATTAATAMNQFHLSGSDSGRVADTLAAGANKSAADVRQLAESLNQSGQVASQFGLGLEDTVATLSLFADSGLKGSDAGTSLRTMLLRLANPAEESKRAMHELGLEAYDAGGQFVGMENLSGQLQDKLKGLTQQQRDQALATIFGSDSIRAANVLLHAGSAGFAEYAAAVTDQGAASEFAAKQMDNLSGDVERLGGSIETALIQGGSGATPVLRGMAQAAESAVNIFAGLPTPVTGAATALAGVSGMALLVGGSISFLKPKVEAARASLVDLGKGGEFANRGLGLLGRTAVVASQLLAVAAAADYLNTKIADLTHKDVSVSRLTNALLDLDESMGQGKGFKASGELADKYGRQLQGLGKDLLEFKNANQGGGRQGNFIAGFGASLGRQSPQYKNTLKDIDALDKALSGMMRAGGPQAEAAKRIFASLSADAKRLGLDQGTVRKAFNDTSDAIAEQEAKGKVDKKTKQEQAGAAGMLSEELQKVSAEVDEMATKAGLAGPALRGMLDPEAAKEFLKSLADVSEKVQSAFLSDMDVTTHITADPAKIKDAQAQVAELQKQGKPIPIELSLSTRGPLDQLKQFYAEAIPKGRQFSADYTKAIELGFDKDFLTRLILQGPEKAGPMLAALVSKQGQGMVGLVNTAEAEIRRTSTAVQEETTKMLIDQQIVQTLTTKAVEDNSGKRTATLANAVKVQRAILLLGEGATFDQVRMVTGLKTAEIQKVVDAWGFKLFAGIDAVLSKFDADRGFSPGTSAGAYAGAAAAAAHSAQGNIFLGDRVWNVAGDVRNAHQPEIVRGGSWRAFGEAETMGESYVPHANDHRRPRAQGLLAQTARIIGMVAMPVKEFRARLDRDTVRLADGAVVARHEWVGGSQRRGSTVEESSPNAPLRPTLVRTRERHTLERFAAGGMRERRSDRDHQRELQRDRAIGWTSASSYKASSTSDRRASERVERHADGSVRVSSVLDLLRERHARGDVVVGHADRGARKDDGAKPRTAAGSTRHPVLAAPPLGPVVLPDLRLVASSGVGDVARTRTADQRGVGSHGSTLRRLPAGLRDVHAAVAPSARPTLRPGLRERVVERFGLGQLSGPTPARRALALEPVVHAVGRVPDAPAALALGGLTARPREVMRALVGVVRPVEKGVLAPAPQRSVGTEAGQRQVRHAPTLRERVVERLAVRREGLEPGADRHRVPDHRVGRARRAVAGQPYLEPIQPAGHVVAEAARRAPPDVMAPQHAQLATRLVHGLRPSVRDDRRAERRDQIVRVGGQGYATANRAADRPKGHGLQHLDRDPNAAVMVEGDRAKDQRPVGLHAPTVRRLALGDLLPAVPLAELMPYNVGPQGAGRRGLTATEAMRQGAATTINRRERDVNILKMAIASRASAAPAGGVGGGAIGSGWASITNYLARQGVNFIVTSTTGGNHVAGSYHYRGKAADLVGTARSSMSTIFDTLAVVGSSLSELFYDPKLWFIKNGRKVIGQIGGHSDHVHAATFRTGGLSEPVALPRQRPFEKERIRKGRDQLEHGPMGPPRRDPVRSRIVETLRKKGVLEETRAQTQAARQAALGGVFRAVAFPDEGGRPDLGYTTLPTENLSSQVSGPLQKPKSARLPTGYEYGGPLYRGPLVPNLSPRDRRAEALAVGDYGRRAKAARDDAHYASYRTPEATLKAAAAASALNRAKLAAFVAHRDTGPNAPALVAHADANLQNATRALAAASQPDLGVSTLPSSKERATLPTVLTVMHGSPAYGVDIGRWAIGMGSGGVVGGMQGFDARRTLADSVPPTRRDQRERTRPWNPTTAVTSSTTQLLTSPSASTAAAGSRPWSTTRASSTGARSPAGIGSPSARERGRERDVARRAQPHVRFALGGIAAPAPFAERVDRRIVEVSVDKREVGRRPQHDPQPRARRERREEGGRFAPRTDPATGHLADDASAGRRRKNSLEQGLLPGIHRESTVDRRVLRLGGFAPHGDMAIVRVPSFGGGGTVPGRPGEPKVIVAHGGERVDTPAQVLERAYPRESVRPRTSAATLAPGAGGAHFDVKVELDVGSIGGDVTLDDVQREVGKTVESAVKKAGDRYLAGFNSGA